MRQAGQCCKRPGSRGGERGASSARAQLASGSSACKRARRRQALGGSGRLKQQRPSVTTLREVWLLLSASVPPPHAGAGAVQPRRRPRLTCGAGWRAGRAGRRRHTQAARRAGASFIKASPAGGRNKIVWCCSAGRAGAAGEARSLRARPAGRARARSTHPQQEVGPLPAPTWCTWVLVVQARCEGSHDGVAPRGGRLAPHRLFGRLLQDALDLLLGLAHHVGGGACGRERWRRVGGVRQRRGRTHTRGARAAAGSRGRAAAGRRASCRRPRPAAQARPSRRPRQRTLDVQV